MKILHTADWHIGSFKGPEENGVNLRGEDTIQCLNELIRVAQKEQPDLILVSGDIFHQAEIWQGRSHREVLRARSIILELSKTTKKIIVMRGTPNHDSEEAFDELKAHFEFIDNIHIVSDNEVVRTDRADIVAIPGFDKGMYRAKVAGLSKEEENIVFTKQLEDWITELKKECSDDKLNILMSHYTVVGCNTESGQIQLIAQNEPVITPEILLSSNYDLVAMGHIHRPQKIKGLNNVYYCGAINAMNFNDEGQKRGFWIHEFDGKKYIDSRFYETPYREFKTIRWGTKELERVINSQEELSTMFLDEDIADKIVRIIYTCTPEQRKALNTASIENALHKAGAFWMSDMAMEKSEITNKIELSGQSDPKRNLKYFLKEKQLDEEEINRILEKANSIIDEVMADVSTTAMFGSFEPVEIEVKNYRNYVEQKFSFRDISFCTINGQNGSGKSSLFMDAILDCLYEEPREGELTGWIRKDAKAKSGMISFTFKIGEKIFRVVRTRTKSGKATLNLSELIDEEWIDKSKEKYRDTQEEIVKIIGMDSLTFKACVLIMQDQYGIFLEANKEDRMGVLSNLMGLGIYSNMEGIAKNKALEVKRIIGGKKKTIEIHNSTLNGYGNPNLEKKELGNIIRIKQEELSMLNKQKEEKSLMLKMKSELEKQYAKSIENIANLEKKQLEDKKILEQIQEGLKKCDDFLKAEANIKTNVEKYNVLVEKEKAIKEKVLVYQTKSEELRKLDSQIKDEKAQKEKVQKELEKLNVELEQIGEIKEKNEIEEKAKQYQEKKNRYDELMKLSVKVKEYELKLEQENSKLKEINIEFDKQIAELQAEEKNLLKKVEILQSVGCVDIDNANCRFLKDAKEAQIDLKDYKLKYNKIYELRDNKLEEQNKVIEKIKSEIKDIGYAEEVMVDLKKECVELEEYEKLLKEIQEKENKKALILTSLEHIKNNISEIEKRINNSEKRNEEIKVELKAYQEIEKTYTTIIVELEKLKTYIEAEKKIPVIKERRKNGEEKLQQVQKEITELLEQIKKEKEEKEKLPKIDIDLSQIKIELEKLELESKNINAELEKSQLELGAVEQKLKESMRLKEEITVIENEIKSDAEELSDYETLKIAFSQDGIPHQIIRSLIPQLTEVANVILGQMTEGKTGIELKTERVLKSNSNKEVVALDIFIEEYGKSVLPYLSKSGGEKVKASLAVILALAEIKSSVAGVQLGMLFIDEPPFLDSEGIQAYCDAMETIQRRYNNIKIMAITHDPTMKARFPQSIDVIKTEEGSRILASP